MSTLSTNVTFCSNTVDLVLSTSDVYTLNDIRTLLNNYFTSQQLINQRDHAYINLNDPLLACIASRSSGESGKKASKSGKNIAERLAAEEKSSREFMKRDELMKKIVEHMQSWYEVKAEGKDTVTTYVSLSRFSSFRSPRNYCCRLPTQLRVAWYLVLHNIADAGVCVPQ